MDAFRQRLCADGASGQSAGQAAGAGDRSAVAGADRLSSANARHRSRPGPLVAGVLAALVHRSRRKVRSRSCPRSPDDRERRAFGRWPHLEDQAAQRCEVARRHAVHGRRRQVLARAEQQSRLSRAQPCRPQPGQGHHDRRARRDSLADGSPLFALHVDPVAHLHGTKTYPGKGVRPERFAVPQFAGRHRAVPLGRARTRRPYPVECPCGLSRQGTLSRTRGLQIHPGSHRSLHPVPHRPGRLHRPARHPAELPAGGEDAEGAQDLRLVDVVS